MSVVLGNLSILNLALSEMKGLTLSKNSLCTSLSGKERPGSYYARRQIKQRRTRHTLYNNTPINTTLIQSTIANPQKIRIIYYMVMSQKDWKQTNSRI